MAPESDNKYEQEQQRQREYRKTLWEKLRDQSIMWKRSGGLDITENEFSFLQTVGGQIIKQNIPYVDNCFLHRLKIESKDKEIYFFKTITEKQQDFYPPF